ncbi:MAG: hypothetical protein MI974_19455 [Chitinophagales bacterium]|nr:hypothetical protein [Chitinophagales bacterium]
MTPEFLINLGEMWFAHIRIRPLPAAEGEANRRVALRLASHITDQLNENFSLVPGKRWYEPLVHYGMGDDDAPPSYENLVSSFARSGDGGQADARAILGWMEGEIDFENLTADQQIFAVITHLAETGRGMAPRGSGLAQFLDQIINAPNRNRARYLWRNITRHYSPALKYDQDTRNFVPDSSSSESDYDSGSYSDDYGSSSGYDGEESSGSGLASEDGTADGTSGLSDLMDAAEEELGGAVAGGDLATLAEVALL